MNYNKLALSVSYFFFFFFMNRLRTILPSATAKPPLNLPEYSGKEAVFEVALEQGL